MKRWLKYTLTGAVGAFVGLGASAQAARAWSLAEASAPYKGMTI